jgi:hypothetical protein
LAGSPPAMSELRESSQWTIAGIGSRQEPSLG